MPCYCATGSSSGSKVGLGLSLARCGTFSHQQLHYPTIFPTHTHNSQHPPNQTNQPHQKCSSVLLPSLPLPSPPPPSFPFPIQKPSPQPANGKPPQSAPPAPTSSPSPAPPPPPPSPTGRTASNAAPARTSSSSSRNTTSGRT